jgi:hypothetical protein
MTHIVTTSYRYKPPPRKRKAVPLAGPAVVPPKRKRVLPAAEERKLKTASAIVWKAKPCNDNRPEGEAEIPTAGKTVSARRPGKRFADVPDLTPDEHQRRGDTADALWRELVRRATGKDRP